MYLLFANFKLFTERNPVFSGKTMGRPKNKKLRIIPLGGLEEIGKNCTALECGDDIVIIDCGMGFPDDDMLGIDTVVPDFTYLVENKAKIKGLLLTHGHEDHIGAVPHLLQKINVPIYATKLTLGIVQRKLEEFELEYVPQLNIVQTGEKFSLGIFEIEFIHVNHSIADAAAIAINTPVGMVIHSGDFKIDSTPIDGQMIDLTRFGELGRQGVKLFMCESTNVERPGFTPSEKKVGESLVRYFDEYKKKRIIITTFSSNVHRVQQIINISIKHDRHVAIIGRSMVNAVSAAVQYGYMTIPKGTLIEQNEIGNFPPEKVTIISTGSQGEPMSALHRITFDPKNKLDLGQSDLVIISASAIPGNEKLLGNVINALCKKQVTVLTDSQAVVHVSGHACADEIKIMHALIKPQYFMPIHGEARQLYCHKQLAEQMGMKPSNIFVSELGRVLEIDSRGAQFNGTVPSGSVMIDGSNTSDIGNVVISERQKLSKEGIIFISATIDTEYREVISGPEIVSRGFIYESDNLPLVNEIKNAARNAIFDTLSEGSLDFALIRSNVKSVLGELIYTRTKRKPLIITIVMGI